MFDEFELKLHEDQFKFVLADARAICMFAGSGAGATYGGCARAFMAACGMIGNSRIPTPNTGLITAPNYLMLKETTLRTFLEIAKQQIVSFNKADMVATMINGSEVLFRSADDPAGWETENLLWWFGDDAAFYPSFVKDSILERLHQYQEQGWWWLTTGGPGIPAEDDWVKSQFIDNPQADQMTFRIPTWRNPFLDAQTLALLAKLYGEDFNDDDTPVYPPFNVYGLDNGR